MEKNSQSYKLKNRANYLVLLVLTVLTLISAALAGTKLGTIAVAGTLIMAGVEAYLLLWHFMGLRNMKKVYSVVAGLALFLFVVVLIMMFR